MTLRSRAALADRPAPVSKGFGTGIPPEIEAAEQRSQMGPTSPFSPGEPIGPYEGFSRTPRAHNYVTGTNISARPRIHEAVAFETLKGLIRSYDVAGICVRHRIASLRSLDFKLIAMPGYEGDVTADIAEGMRVLKRPDGKTLFKPWLAKYLRDVLSFDAGTLYRMRNRAGRAVGLTVVDGTLIAPLQDYWGARPDCPAPAFVQYVQGLPWNWLTSEDLVYEPYDPQPDSMYGRAPLEDVLLSANTDIRFQLYFLERFTQGNLPAGFASSPDTWSPDQIEQFQEYWDAFMLGDQTRKHQIRWIPSGSKLAWSNEKDFSDSFSLFLMRKACAAFSIVPSDLGFTESVNRSSGESQADVQHRVGDLPMAHHVQDILSSFLQDDLQLPLKFAFDLGEEQDDRADQATADKIYSEMGAIGVSKLREMRYGLTDPVPVPRYIFTERAGPIPIASLLAVAGEIDPATSLPAIGATLPKEVFGGTEGVLPNPPIKVMSLAEREFGESAMPPAPPPQPKMTPEDEGSPQGGPVAKEGEGAGGNATAGITAATGLYSYDLDGQDDEDGPADQAAVAKEMQAFRRFSKARRRDREWRDFEFRAVAKVAGHNLNDSGRLAVRKDSGEVAVAGLAVLAADTGRVLMLQRALCDDDPAAGKLEFPGGHLEGAETPLQGAWREWAEETGAVPPPGVETGSWTAGDGIYQGIVWTAESEASVPVRGGAVVPNPDADPDGDSTEAILWMDPEDLPGNPAVRAELLASIDDVMAALGYGVTDDAAAEVDGVAKAAKSVPKGRAWHGWTLDEKTAAHWAPKVRDSVRAAVPKATARDMGRDYLADHPQQDGAAPDKRDRNKAAAAWIGAWLGSRGITMVSSQTAEAIAVDGYAIGAVSAAHQVTGETPGAQKPGDTATALDRVEEAGLAAALALLLHGGNGNEPAAEIVAEAIASGYGNALAIILAGTDADWADSQDTLDELGDLLSEALADEDTAVTLVGTEITFYTGLSAQAYYLANSITEMNWVTNPSLSGVCPVCEANAAASPQPNGQPWPSGDLGPPIHANCVIGSTRVTVPVGVVPGEETAGLSLDPALLAGVGDGDPGLATAAAVAVAERDFGRGNIRAVSVRDYVGEIITIRTALGHELTATPNHPVATRGGWVPIAELKVGDHVLSSTASQWEATAVNPDVDDVPPRIEDVAQTFPVLLGPVPASAEDFHGDGAGSDVYVVRADGLLVDRLGAGGEEPAAEHLLGCRHTRRVGAEGLDGGRSGEFLAERHDAPANRVMGGLGEPGALLGGSDGHAQQHRVPAPARLHAGPEQPSADAVAMNAEGVGERLRSLPGEIALDHRRLVDEDSVPVRAGLASGATRHTPFDEPVADALVVDAEGFSDLLEAVAGEIAADEVVDVLRAQFAGHVYNLDTLAGWYFGNGIVTHNCRCALLPAWL